MPGVASENYQIDQRDHPFGEAGVNKSLEEVAKKASKGAVHPRVRRWAIECLERARKEQGLQCDNDRERAEVIFRAVQKKLWVADPAGSEWMAGAHLMSCDRDDEYGVCFRGGDCDDLCVLLAACLMSVGIYVLIVGHSYDSSQRIGHVLCAARIDGKWMYADPTPDDFRLGQCVPFTRERTLSCPNVQVLCDDRSCIKTDPTKFDPETNGFISKGVFVGVDGIPKHPVKFTWLGQKNNLTWLGQTPVQGEEILDSQEEEERTLDAGEKILLASFLLSLATLGWNIYTWRKES